MTSPVTVIWTAVAASCLTLAIMHAVIGFRQPDRAHLLFALNSLSVVAIAILELALMRASSPETFGHLLRWIQVPIYVLVVSLVLFVRAFFRAGRTWLASAVVAARTAALVVNFLRDPNLNYVRITALRRVPLLGEDVSVANGVISRWNWLGQLSSVLLLAYLVDAVVTVWRRGDRRRAAFVGGSGIVFVLLAAGHTALVHAGFLAAPYLISASYVGLIAASSYELTEDVVRAAEVARRLADTQKELRASESRLALAADAANLGLWAWDTASGEFFMSEKARSLRGYSPGERIDLPRFLASVHPEDQDRVGQSVEESVARGGEFEREYRIVRPNGEVRWLSALGRVEIPPESGSPRVLGVSIDVTRRRVAELDLERSRNQITHLSRVTMLAELSGSLAHELNQPLTSILSNAQAGQRFLAQGRGGLEEIQRILEDIVAEDKRAGEVIRRLRTLLKKGEIEAQALDVGEIMHEALQLMHSDLVNRGVSSQAEIPAGLPRVRGDRIQIQQVLMNLSTNACDAMLDTEKDRRRLLFRAEAIPDEGVRLSVADAGRGIPPGEIERVFEPFVSTKTQGLGLGLSVCRAIVTAHGGRLWATNNSDCGATFHFTIPAFDAELS